MKKPFILIEVLFAFTIALLFTTPLVQHSIKFYAKEVKLLETMECQRFADLTFCEVKELLLRNEVPWDEMPHKEKTSNPFPLPDMKLQLPGFKEKTVSRYFILKGRGEKLGTHDEDARQLGVLIYLNKEKYEFRTPVIKMQR